MTYEPYVTKATEETLVTNYNEGITCGNAVITMNAKGHKLGMTESHYCGSVPRIGIGDLYQGAASEFRVDRANRGRRGAMPPIPR